MNRTLIEEHLYRECVNKLGDVERLDEALRGLLWALSSNPEHYQVILGTKRMRVAKTDGYGNTPRLLLFFSVEPDDCVHLWWIEQDGETVEGDGECQ